MIHGSPRASLPHGSSSRLAHGSLPAIVFVAGVGYTLTAPRWILGGDNGEFSSLYATGGIAHPPGYPSMVLWLRLWHWLPVDTPARGAALATVLLGAMAVWTVQRACLAWGASPAATAFASAVYAFSPLAWKLSSHAEVFAMNAMFAGAILALSAPARSDAQLGDSWLLGALGLLAGVAIANHQSIVLLAPIGLLAALRGVQEAKRPGVAALVGILALFAGLLLPYAYLYAVAKTSDPRTTPMWIEAPTLAGVFFHFRRGAYGTLTLSDVHVERQSFANLALFTKSALRQMLGMPLIILLAGSIAIAKKRAHRRLSPRIRNSMLGLGAAFLLAGPLFVAWFNLPMVGAGSIVAERFYLLPEVVLTIMGALSLDALVPWLLARGSLAVALTLQAALVASIFTVPEVLEYNRPTVELYVENTLRAAPRDALIVGGGDHRWGGFMYARYALHLRPDVLFVAPGPFAQAWYRRDIESHASVSLDTPDHRPVGPKTLMARLLATGRPLFYTDWPDPKVEDTPHYAVGTLMRVLRPGEAPPSPEDLLALNVAAFETYEEEPTLPEDVHSWGYDLQKDYARAWGELGERYGAAGDVAKEQACYARAARWAPWLVGREQGPISK